LLKIYEKMKDDVEVLSINPINPAGRVKAESKSWKLPFPVLTARGSRIIMDYQVMSLPRLVIVDKSGKAVFIGEYLSYEELEEKILELMPSNAETGGQNSEKG